MSAQEDNVQLTPEQIAAAEKTAQEGRVSDLDAAAKKQAEAAAAALKEESDEAVLKDDKTKKSSNEDEPPKEDEEEEDTPGDNSWKEEWLTVGNVHADAAIGLMKKAGMTPVEGNAVFDAALKSGNLEDVNWEVLEARLGKDAATLVRTGVENYYNTEYKAQLAVQQYAYGLVGGEKEWTKVQKWAAKLESTDQSFAAELSEWRQALSVGGFAAKAAVDAIKSKYESAPGNSSTNRHMERGSATPKDTNATAWTRAQYYEAMEKAGGDRAPEHLKAEYRRNREAGRAKGI